MEQFTAYNPVKLHFGKDVCTQLGSTISKISNKVLLVYGGGSIKKNGIYNKIVNELVTNSIEFCEFHGIKPNPIVEDVEKAVKVAKENKVGLVLAVGGGSVIDSAKIIAICTSGEYDVWQVMKGKQKPDKALPLVAVLTLAATGTEMNPYAVLQNHATGEKIGYGNNNIFPKHSFLDPEFTLSVPKNYTAYGIADIIAHSLEAYFGKGNSPLTDRFIFSIIKESIEAGNELINNLDNYSLRERILWASTCALNGMTVYGKKSGDWGVHGIGHCISLLYDIPHGATLSIVYPAWLKLQKGKASKEIQKLGIEVFETMDTDKTISNLESFFASIGCPIRLSELKLPENAESKILSQLIKNKASGYNYALAEEDYKLLIELMR